MPQLFRSKRILLTALSAFALVAFAAALVVYLLARPPQFYSQVDRLSAEDRDAESKQFVRRSASIWNQMANDANWSGTFSERQVNAWLVEDFVEKKLVELPAGVSDPRVAFDQGRVYLAFKRKLGALTTLVSVGGRVWLPEPNLIALELEEVQAGAIPLPTAPIVQMLSAAAKSAKIDIEWQQYAGHPVALIRLKGPENQTGLGVERIELQKGVLYVAGRSLQAASDKSKRRSAEDHDDADSGNVSMNSQSPDSTSRR